jgi:hypothetical protein
VTVADEDAELLARAAAWTGPDLDFAQLAQTDGLDFATAVLYDRLSRVPANAQFSHRVRDAHQTDRIHADVIGIVPGAFHREHRNTGADGSRVTAIASRLGCHAEVVPTKSCGTLDENARAILGWLKSHDGRRIALICLSKGGADVKRALALPGAAEAFASVSAWINLSGIVQGTPLIAWLRNRPLRWWAVRLWLCWHGYTARAIEELRHGSGTVLAEWPAVPAHLQIVHVCGFPLARHLAHPWAPRGYARLSPLGPNDGGGILLADLPGLPGIVFPIWGADHYLEPHWDILPMLTGVIAAALTQARPRETRDINV